MTTESLLHRALILAPTGREAAIARTVLTQGGIAARVCDDLDELVVELSRGAGTAVLTEEALRRAKPDVLTDWLAAQPRWSDFPFVALTSADHDGAPTPRATALLDLLRNVTLLERPIRAITLVSAVQAALRARDRQYEVRAYIGEREEKEAELRHLNDKLERHVVDRTQRLVTANRRLLAEIEERRRTEDALRQAQKMQAVGQLTGGIAHDFNNLLTVISGNLEMLQAKLQGGSPLHRLVDAAIDGVDRAARLTQQLLAFSRKQHLDPRPMDLNAVVNDMTELLRRTVGESIRFTIALAPDLRAALGDRNQLEAALLNLVNNARDAMPNGGEITIASRNAQFHAIEAAELEVAPGCYAQLSVTDTGTGMPPEIAGRVFEPFFTTKEIGKGSGLGLSMVYGFVRQSKGMVRVESEPGRGTSVNLYLPQPAAARAAPSKPRRAAANEVAVEPQGGRILVVEDSDEVREIAVSVLADFGFSVVAAPDAASALEILARTPGISLVFTDVAMPGEMSGVDLAQVIAERWPALRLILTSGYAERLVNQDGMPPHIAYLRKPYKPLDLVSMIKGIISEPVVDAGRGTSDRSSPTVGGLYIPPLNFR